MVRADLKTYWPALLCLFLTVFLLFDDRHPYAILWCLFCTAGTAYFRRKKRDIDAEIEQIQREIEQWQQLR